MLTGGRPPPVDKRCLAMAGLTPTMYCLTCDYVLDGLREHRCPECGRAFDPADPASFYSPGRSRPTAAGLRCAHEFSLLLVAIVFYDCLATKYLRSVWGVFGKRYEAEVLTCVFLIGAAISIICGILFVRHHRRDRCLLPVRSYLTYLAAAVGWSFFLMVLLHDVAHLYFFGCLPLWLGTFLFFAVPWLVFRSRQPPPVLVDAVLCSLVVIAAWQFILPQPSPGFSPVDVLYQDEGEVLVFVVLVAVMSAILMILPKRGFNLLTQLALRGIAIIVLVLIIFLLCPRVVA